MRNDPPRPDVQTAVDLPLTAAQEGIWLGQQLAPASPRYNAAECITLDPAVDVEALARAITCVVAESESLRARVHATARGPRQSFVAEPFVPRTLRVGSLAEAEGWMREDLARPLDLAHESPYRGAILRGPEAVYWYHAAHHFALDGYGFAMVARRVADLYGAEVARSAPPPCPFQGVQAVVDEDRAYREGEAAARDRAFWCGQLAGMSPPARFCAGSAFPADVALRARRALAPALSAELAAVAKRARGTWGDAMIAALARTLHRATGAAEVVLGLPVMGRIGSVSLKVPCMAMNVVPLRLAVDESESFVALTARVVAALRALRPHARYRYEQLRRDVGLVGGDKRLFGPVINLMPFDLDLRFGPTRAVVHNLLAGPVEDLSVGVIAHGDGRGPRIELDANPHLYAPAALAAIGDAFLATLADAARAPDATATSAPPPTPYERVTWGAPLAAPAEDVVQAFLRCAREAPEAVAVEEGARRTDYATLARRAAALAARLRECGVGRDDLVALALPRSTEAIVAMLGVLMAGAAYVPLDVDGPAGRRAAVCADARPLLVVTDAVHADRVDPGLAVLTIDDRAAGALPEAREADEAALAYVIYTSGSTGQPNGVAIGRGALAHFVAAAAERYGIAARDRVLQFAPLHFDACVEEIYLSLTRGATLVLRDEPMLGSLAAFARACAAGSISVLDLPTAFFHELAFALASGTATLPACVHTVIIGGEAALPEGVARFRAAAPAGTRLFNTYGPTEATVVATTALLAGEGAVADADAAPIGSPLAGVGAVIVDPAGNPVRAGEPGELCLLGPALARGYLGRPALDAQRFITLAALPERPRAYRTGDRVRRRPDGLLAFVGRLDDELKISGQRVDPSEVEAVLLRHPQVREACVVAVGAPPRLQLVAHVVAGAPAPSPSALRAHAREALLAAAVPQVFQLHEALPKTRAGKLDRAALRALRLPEAAREIAGSPLERQVLAALTEVLGADLALEDDFFERGGHSLQTIQVANRLTVLLGREVDATLIFRHPSAAELARALSDDAREAAPGAPWLDDARLAPDVQPLGAPADRFDEVLLTGATGFVGVHLLHQLLSATRARVTCLVRADDDASALARVRRALAQHALAVPDFDARVQVLRGNLSAPLLGLTAETYQALCAHCDAVVHAAAAVSLTRGYASLRSSNVGGTEALLRFASTARPKAVHHVSTIAVAHDPAAGGVLREAFVPAHAGLADGYAQSKWAAEHLIEQARARGFAASVYRLGRVVGPLSTGFVNPDDILWRIVRAGIACGALPALDVCEPWTPVDWVARALVTLATDARAGGGVFHLTPPPLVRLADVFSWVREYGYDVNVVPVPEFIARLHAAADDDTAATRAFFALRADGAAAPSLTAIACARLQRVEEPPRAIDRAAVHHYLAHCERQALLPAVPPSRSGANA